MILHSKTNPQSESFKTNYSLMKDALEKLSAAMRQSLFQGKEKHIESARKKGKLLARERIELLLDRDSPFLELLPLAGGTGGTMVGGIGAVNEKLCMIVANVGTNKGGAIDYATLQKSLRLNEIAMENELPVIYLVESAGANLPEQEKIFNYGGITFREITRRSKKGLTTISVVFGNSTAGGAYIPGMSDYTIFIKNQAKVFLAGPPLVKMATGEITNDESLGGADMHSRVSGVSDYLAEDELDGLRIARDIMEWIKTSPLSPLQWRGVSEGRGEVFPPKYSSEEILGIVSTDLKKSFDAREIIARIVDGSEFHEFKKDYGTTLVTGWAEIHGYKIGILANNGVIFSDSANKGAHFIQLCNSNDIPLVFLQNTTGFMVGKKYEEEGIIKHGAKLVNAVSNSTVPAITIMMGASYGAGNYAMCGRAYQPRFLFSWVNSKIAVMGQEQLSGVMEIIQREAAQKMGIEYNEDAAKQMRQQMMKDVEQKSDAFYSSSQLWDDGVIDPRETRNYLAFCLEVVHNIEIKGTKEFGVFRM